LEKGDSSLGNNITITVIITEPLGTSCRRLIYNVGLVAEKLGLEMEITSEDDVKINTGEHITPPFIMIGDLVLGKDISAERLEQIIKDKILPRGKEE